MWVLLDKNFFDEVLILTDNGLENFSNEKFDISYVNCCGIIHRKQRFVEWWEITMNIL